MKNRFPGFNRTVLFGALSLGLGSCGDASEVDASRQVATADAPAARPMSEAQLVAEVEANLQACSYDGSPVAFNAGGLRMGVNADGKKVVAEIMRFTGLPQNFEVVEHPQVPNAAAVILLGEDKLPKRVIAYNPGFMNDVRRATANNDWAPISIMAHEIGHHLSGHTIQPGGSQPPTELEADKFSGYVLYKMGAMLADAQKAMNTLVPETDGRTHPGRGKRVRAIEEGWKQACSQQSDDCSGTVTAAVAANPPAAASTPAPSTPAASAPSTAASAASSVAAAAKPVSPSAAPEIGQPLVASAGQVDVLPTPDAAAVPAKFDKFIYDEMGVLDTTWRAKFEKEMYDHAAQWGVEIVTLLVKDLHGLSGDEYARTMLRQLRVGKLDVGNGAVLVIAPDSNEVGIALGAGVALEMQFHDKKKSLERWVQAAWPTCRKNNNCGNWTENFMLASDHIRRDTDGIDWTVRYQTLAETMAAHQTEFDARRNGGAANPAADPHRKIARLAGEVLSLSPPVGNKRAWVNESAVKRGRKAVHVQGEDGYTVMLYVDPSLEAQMPAGALVAGKKYVFNARVSSLSWNRADTNSFDLLSYDLAE